MIKLLQKYKMYILVVAGILIMVGFLLGDFIRQLSQYSMENERVYTLDGKKVSKADLQNARHPTTTASSACWATTPPSVSLASTTTRHSGSSPPPPRNAQA